MKKISIILIFLFAIPYAAYSQTHFGFTGGGSGGGGATVDPGSSIGEMLFWEGTKWTPATGLSWDEPNTSLVLPQGSVLAPALAFGDGDSGMTETADDILAAIIGNTAMWQFRGGNFESLLSVSGPMLRGATPTATAPNIRPNQTDSDTGIGWAGADILTLTAAAIPGLYIDGNTSTAYTGDGWLFEIPNGFEKTTLKTDANGHFFCLPSGDNIHIGASAGQLYSGSGGVGVGQFTLFNATGNNLTALGSFAAQSSAGAGVTAVGNSAGYQNNAPGLAALGELAARNNLGASTSAFGDQSAYLNTGALGTFLSTQSGRQNTGVCSTGIGNNTLRVNDSDYAGALGCDAWSTFTANVAGNKTFAFSDINITTDRVTVTGHGFGPNLAYKNLLYTEGTSPINGLTSGAVYQIRIIDSNTIGFNELVGPGGIARGTNITAAGTGTGHTLTPQFEFDNTIVIGNNAVPTLADSIILAGDHEHIVIGAGAANIDYDVTFDGETNDGKLTWKEDEAILDFDSTFDSKSINISSVISPPTITTDLNDWNPTGLSSCRVIEVITDGSNHDITGIQAIASRVIIIQNIGSGIGTANVILKHDDTGSLAANRMLLPAGADVTLQRYKSVTLRYADSQSRWMVLSEQP